MKIFSFFAGAGFLDLGFELSGFNVCYVNEWHRPFMTGYIHSRRALDIPTPRWGYSLKSVEELKTCEKLDQAVKAEKKSGELIGFIGGPPCPDFSIAGKNRGSEGENGKLSRCYIDLVIDKKPDFFLFENVKGLYRTKKHREFFEKLKADLSTEYFLHERLVNAIEYGVPQDRDRIILLGFRRSPFRANTFDWGNIKYPNRSAFKFAWPNTQTFSVESDLPIPDEIPLELTVQHWFRANKVDTHPNARHSFKPRAGLARFETVAEGDDSKKSYKRLHRWRFSPTAAYGNNEVHLHPYKARRITVAEALAIQSLPAKFELPDTMTLTDMFKTVGNGVPFLAAKGIADAIKRHIHASHRSKPSPRNQSVAEECRV